MHLEKKHGIISKLFTWSNEITQINKSMIETNDRNGENVPHLEITEVVLQYCKQLW